MENSKQLPEKIEELILNIADKDFTSAEKLVKILKVYQTSRLPKEIAQLVTDNLNILMEDLDILIQNSHIQELLCVCLAIGLDSMHLRDAFAAVVKEVNSSYPDPSGLTSALGIFDVKLTTQEIYSRWNVFLNLKDSSIVWHPSYGLGRVVEVDALSDLVCVKFKHNQHFKLAQLLTSLSVAKENSSAVALMSEENVRLPPEKTPKEFDQHIAGEFVPQLKEPQLVAEALLVPRRMDKRSYLLWRSENQADTFSKPKVVQERSWNNARSIEELKICLAKVKTVNPKQEDITHLRKIFSAEAVKPLSKVVFGEGISILWSYCPSASWFIELIKDLPEDTVAWASKDSFIEVTCKLPAKLVPNWLQISDIAKGHERLIDLITELPLRFWPSPKNPLMKSQHFVDDLSAAALEKLRLSKASAGPCYMALA